MAASKTVRLACGSGCACPNCLERVVLDCGLALSTLPQEARGAVVAALALATEVRRPEVSPLRPCHLCGLPLHPKARAGARGGSP